MKQFSTQTCCDVLTHYAPCSMAGRSCVSLLAFRDKPHKCSHEVMTIPSLTQSTPFAPLAQQTSYIKNTGIFLCAIQVFSDFVCFSFLSYYFTFPCLYAFRLYHCGFLLPLLTIPFSAFSITFPSWKCLNIDLGLFLNEDYFRKKRRVKMH